MQICFFYINNMLLFFKNTINIYSYFLLFFYINNMLFVSSYLLWQLFYLFETIYKIVLYQIIYCSERYDNMFSFWIYVTCINKSVSLVPYKICSLTLTILLVCILYCVRDYIHLKFCFNIHLTKLFIFINLIKKLHFLIIYIKKIVIIFIIICVLYKIYYRHIIDILHLKLLSKFIFQNDIHVHETSLRSCTRN
jgi:hypothetical protein